MTRMHRDADDIVVEFDEGEAGILGSMATQLAELLEAEVRPGGDVWHDPALRRLLPDAYPDDAEASAEFRRYTEGDLAARKVSGARRLAEQLGSRSVESAPTEVRLDARAADRWLRTLADIRITLASRLGIEQDGDEPPDDATGALYHWLGELQWALIETLDAEGH